MKGNFQEPRTRTLFKAVEEYIGSTNNSFQTFCTHVVEKYVEKVYPRSIEFSRHPDTYKRIELDTQKIRRMMEDKFPAELEESFVAALPDQYRLPLLSKLASRYRLIATPMPTEANHINNFARLLEEVGTTIQSMSPILADGVVNEDDLPHIGAAQEHLMQLIAASYGQYEQLESVKTSKGLQDVQHC